MKPRLLRGIVALSAVLLFPIGASAQMLGTTARQLSKGTLETTVFYQGTSKQHLNFELTDGVCVSTSPLGNVFGCGTTADIDARGFGQALITKFSYQPSERGLIFYASAGVGDYRVTVGSTTVFDASLEDKAGFLTTFGVKGVILPDTIVSPAIALDTSVGIQRYWGGGRRLELMQIQIAMEASHRFVFKDPDFTIEPYGGVKWWRTQAYLKTIATGSRVGGRQKTVTPFLGFKVPFFENDSVFAEVSFVNGIQYASGLAIRFK